MRIGTQDHLDQAVEMFARIEQPFLIIVLDGAKNFNLRIGAFDPQDLRAFRRICQDEVPPTLDEMNPPS